MPRTGKDSLGTTWALTSYGKVTRHRGGDSPEHWAGSMAHEALEGALREECPYRTTLNVMDLIPWTQTLMGIIKEVA